MAFATDGDRIVAVTDTAVEVRDAWPGPQRLPLREADILVTGFAFSPDGGRIATGHLDSRVRVWDARKGQAILTLTGHPVTPNGGVSRLGYSPDGRRISGRDSTGKVMTWDATSGKILPGAEPAAMKERSFAYSPGDKLRVTLDDGGKLWVVPQPESAAARVRQRDAAFAAGLVPPDPAYHRRQADASEKAGDEFAAAFHLRRLFPTDAVRKRLEASLADRLPSRMPYAR